MPVEVGRPTHHLADTLRGFKAWQMTDINYYRGSNRYG